MSPRGLTADFDKIVVLVERHQLDDSASGDQNSKMQSMTGFGRTSVSVGGVTIDLSIKSVNGRYLEVRPHLPKIYSQSENELIKIVKERFSRGSIDIYVQRSAQSAHSTQVHFNVLQAKKWLTDFRKSLKELKMEDTLQAQDLLSIPDFITYQEQNSLSLQEKAALLKALQQALLACEKERVREGSFLQKTCLVHLHSLEKNISLLSGLREVFLTEISLKVQERIKKVMGDLQFDSQRLLQEVGHIVEKSDVDEEIQRFSEHIKRVRGLLKSQQPPGKQLDFYAQELLREINTIGSKSQSAKITEIVVQSKNLIEQFREQIQNIE